MSLQPNAMVELRSTCHVLHKIRRRTDSKSGTIYCKMSAYAKNDQQLKCNKKLVYGLKESDDVSDTLTWSVAANWLISVVVGTELQT